MSKVKPILRPSNLGRFVLNCCEEKAILLIRGLQLGLDLHNTQRPVVADSQLYRRCR